MQAPAAHDGVPRRTVCCRGIKVLRKYAEAEIFARQDENERARRWARPYRPV